MKAVKILAILFGIYIGIVAAFESLIGYFQPAGQGTLVITTVDADGEHQRVLARLESEGQMYVAVNHWPRAWYHRALDNPNVRITLDDGTREYVAVPVTGAEHEQVDRDNSLGAVFRVLTGFPPRYFLRLDSK